MISRDIDIKQVEKDFKYTKSNFNENRSNQLAQTLNVKMGICSVEKFVDAIEWHYVLRNSYGEEETLKNVEDFYNILISLFFHNTKDLWGDERNLCYIMSINYKDIKIYIDNLELGSIKDYGALINLVKDINDEKIAFINNIHDDIIHKVKLDKNIFRTLRNLGGNYKPSNLEIDYIQRFYDIVNYLVINDSQVRDIRRQKMDMIKQNVDEAIIENRRLNTNQWREWPVIFLPEKDFLEVDISMLYIRKRNDDFKDILYRKSTAEPYYWNKVECNGDEFIRLYVNIIDINFKRGKSEWTLKY